MRKPQRSIEGGKMNRHLLIIALAYVGMFLSLVAGIIVGFNYVWWGGALTALVGMVSVQLIAGLLALLNFKRLSDHPDQF